MSRETRAHHRRARRATHQTDEWLGGHNDDIAVLVAWCATDLLEHCKQRTHDALIAMMGDCRTGGVSWKIFEPAAAFRVLDNMVGTERSLNRPDSPELVAHYKKIRQLLVDNDGRMVVAMAPGAPPES